VTKICVVGPSKKYYSGLTAYTICLANALSLQNQVSALTIRNLLPRFLYPGRRNVDRQDNILDFSPPVEVFEGMDWNSPLSWMKAWNFLKKEKPDVIIMAWWTSAVAHMELFVALVNACNIKAKLILELHEIVDPLEASKLGFRLYSGLMGGWIIRRSAAYVVHSEAVKAQAAQVYRLPAQKVFVIPHGIYDSYCQSCSRESARAALNIREPFVILYFGMIRKYKGVPALVAAFNQLPSEVAQNARLIIAGENWGDEEGLEDLIKNSPRADHITLRAEFVPDAAVPHFFSAADVVVLPYLRSAGSGVASLAMAFGKPVIISDLPNIRESLADYRGTFLVPQGEVAPIASCLTALYRQQQAGGKLTFDTPASCGWSQVTGLYHDLIQKIEAPGTAYGP
jgi:glycosyltransferase involved in cell wall biosynthesis